MTTKIEWVARPGTTPETWNPVTGCSKISEGCRNCYAERMAKRLAGRFGYPADEPFRVMLHPDRLEKPLRWRKPRTVFVCSMGDLFHKDVSVDFVDSVFSTMEFLVEHTFMVLTKRPGNMKKYARFAYPSGVPKHIWLGVTAENQTAADERIPLLLETPAAVRFVSCEPLLSSVDLSYWLEYDPAAGARPGLDWVIAGGESGPGARPVHPDWLRGIRDQCQVSGVPFFFKQWGKWAHIPSDTRHPMPQETYWWPDRNLMGRVGKKAAGRLLDGREWNEWPEAR